ncbi:hypothetical protein MAPG_06173 [Magnaporthiopsis poae ATCC 64411]|uniref:AAA+ ATPase domain-containing protein n=1 Tax=Magnaporthiopsis poae (strain ATCC 64411 / 73-15) TaxID=644358 RepID=A0A0C4E1B5_MAGP6|nr:hypothetical protein MAPG_06173 [Magnaporthiopsis poae ATCC 64411]
MGATAGPPHPASGASALAAPTDTANGDKQAKELGVSSHTDEREDAGNTPGKPDADSGLGPQLQKLQLRLAELELAAERDRLHIAEEPHSILSRIKPGYMTLAGVLSSEEYNEHIRQKYLPPRGPPGSVQLAQAIKTLEIQLVALRKEHDAVCKTWSDRDRLRGMEQEWERARQGLPLKQRKSYKAEALAGGQEENAAHPHVYGIAQLNEVNWQTFIGGLRSDPHKPTFAIDILKGDPLVTWEAPVSLLYNNPGSKRTETHSTTTDEKAKSRKAAAGSKQPEVTGQAPLPERIRINSPHICRILEKIIGHEIATPVVMLRPYKALAYYDEPIRQKLEELQAKFGETKSDTRDGATKDGSKEPAPGGNADPEATDEAGLEGRRDSPEAERPKEDGEAEDDEEVDELTYSSTAYEHLNCLVTFMNERLRAKTEYLSGDSCQTVSFSDIWYLFKPGDEVIDQGRRQVYRVIAISSAPHKVFSPYQRSWDKGARAKEETPVFLSCVYIDFDGTELGPMVRRVRIAKFEGEKAVTALEVYPLRFAEEKKAALEARGRSTAKKADEPTLRDRIINRGRMFLDVTSFKHMHYNGLTLDTRDEVDSHVVVDFEEAFSHAAKTVDKSRNELPRNPWRPDLSILIGDSLDEKFDDDGACNAACCYSMSSMIYNDADAEKKRNADYMTFLKTENGQREPSPTIYPRPLVEIKGQENPLSNEELLIMSYRVFGFVLRNRKWVQLNLDHLSLPEKAFKEDKVKNEARAVVPQEGSTTKGDGSGIDSSLPGASDEQAEDGKTAFGQLVLPPGHKEMVTSLVTQHFRDKASGGNADIVRGKGKGLIILLHGAPGVGKTTTAEGVAEMFEKPLFQMTCGDLGTSASEVEKALESHFSLANRWGCILLLDEADVFLAARKKEDFKRNGLVSVFLRVLEYYAGILFLTTNRVGDFDEAFASRIHISLYYPHLTMENTEAIFNLNFDTIEERFKKAGRKIRIEKEIILARARAHFDNHPNERWNGRQIRNACQTALALAEFRAQGSSHLRVADPDAVVELKVDDLQVVSDAYLQFMNYLNDVRGKDAEMWAKAMKLRAREIDVLLYAGVKDRDPATFAALGKQQEVHPEVRNANATPSSTTRPTSTTPIPPNLSPYLAPAPPPPASPLGGAAAPPPGQHQPPYGQGQSFAQPQHYTYQPSHGYGGYAPSQPRAPQQPTDAAPRQQRKGEPEVAALRATAERQRPQAPGQDVLVDVDAGLELVRGARLGHLLLPELVELVLEEVLRAVVAVDVGLGVHEADFGAADVLHGRPHAAVPLCVADAEHALHPLLVRLSMRECTDHGGRDVAEMHYRQGGGAVYLVYNL